MLAHKRHVQYREGSWLKERTQITHTHMEVYKEQSFTQTGLGPFVFRRNTWVAGLMSTGTHSIKTQLWFLKTLHRRVCFVLPHKSYWNINNRLHIHAGAAEPLYDSRETSPYGCSNNNEFIQTNSLNKPLNSLTERILYFSSIPLISSVCFNSLRFSVGEILHFAQSSRAGCATGVRQQVSVCVSGESDGG